MTRFIVSLLASAAALAAAQDPAPPPREVDPPKAALVKKVVSPKAKAGPTSPPLIDAPAEFSYFATFRVANMPGGTEVKWVFPEVLKTERAAECSEWPYDGAVTVGGPPGSYTAKGELIGWDEKRRRPTFVPLPPRAFKILGKVTPPPVPDDDKKDPDDPVDPPPLGKIVKFVVVEDTSKAGAWRGDLLGSPKVAAFYKARGLKHRILSKGLDGQDGAVLDPLAKKFLADAVGKELPWLFALGADGRVVKSEKLALTEEALIAQLTGGEAEFARAMGNLPPPEGRKAKFAAFGSHPNVPIFPRNQWKPVNLGAFLPRVYDQDGIGACNAFSSVTCLEAARAQAGLPYVELSRGYVYGAINGGVDQGSYLEDALDWLTKTGAVKVEMCGHLEWRKGRSLMNNAAAREQARFYRIVEAYECPTFDAIASALQQGFFINEGLAWYNNYNPDREGWLPGRGSGGMGGHALAGYGLASRNGTWGIRTRNSWSAAWGVGGDCIIPESCFDSRIGGYWAVRAVVQTADGFQFTRLRDAERHDRLIPFVRPSNPLAF